MIAVQNVSLAVALLAGVISFFSPCVLPLIPVYITYLAGISLPDDGRTGMAGARIILHALAFICGLFLVFVLLGATATVLGKLLFACRTIVRQIGGLALLLVGISIVGRINLPFCSFGKRVEITNKPAGLIGSFLVGMAFAASWTPCTGPILASILLLASTEQNVMQGIVLLALYSLGMAIPFLLTAMLVNHFTIILHKFNQWLGIVNITAGFFLLIIGLLLLMGRF